MNIYEKLQKIQEELKAPKNQFNSFGKYKYRSLEDILEGLKPIMAQYKVALTISDFIEQVGGRYYLVVTTELVNAEKPEEKIANQARARESENKKGMDSSQLTGATSSYARKYALNGLFAIDDTKDADNMDNSTSEQTAKKEVPKKLPKDKVDTIKNLANEKEVNVPTMLEFYKVKDIEDMSIKQFGHCVNYLNNKESQEDV